MGLALVVMVPLVVAGLLTWSLGGAMDNIGSVQAAVVNLDEGGTMTTADGTVTELALGDDLTTALTPSDRGGEFTWVAADEAEATAGLADGTYAAVLTIPAEFSRTVAAHPRRHHRHGAPGNPAACDRRRVRLRAGQRRPRGDGSHRRRHRAGRHQLLRGRRAPRRELRP